MKKIFLLLLLMNYLLVLVSCDSSSKFKVINSHSTNTEITHSSLREGEVFGSISTGIDIVVYEHYPEDFLTMRYIEDLDDYDDVEPFIYASGKNANGTFRVVFYKDYDTFEIDLISEWDATQIVYKNGNYTTSEGISVKSAKSNVLNAYEKYGVEEFKLSKISQMGLDSIDIILKGIDLADTFLYIDNGNVFDEAYTGTDYWGGLGAYIFILDSNDSVIKIVSCCPTSG